VQVDPIKPTLEPTGTKRLKLKCDVLLSTAAFKFDLRRYTLVSGVANYAFAVDWLFAEVGEHHVNVLEWVGLRQGLTIVP
jgi:hypothetical protein